ncbi:MAG: DUF2520 domain-containing protein [Lachnospiraceae bacterium]|nr:DUF2520 domain-containing protein [Lachnospiraceae bacterium]
MQIGIIGAGKVGVTLGKYLKEHQIPVTGFYSKSRQSIQEACRFTGTKEFYTLKELVCANDTLFVTTPDGVIGEIWDQIAKNPIRNKTICHFSGSLSCDVFSNRKEAGAFACSIHPIYPFDHKFSAYLQFHKAVLTMEGDKEAVDIMAPLLKQLGHKVFEMEGRGKRKYHAAASMASNHMLALLETSVRLLRQCGFSEKDAYEVLGPLVSSNLENALQKGVKEALTGPIERNDISTVSGHIEELTAEERAIYKSLGQLLIEIAEEKHPDRDYGEIENILRR